MFKWFDAREHQEFGRVLAKFIVEKLLTESNGRRKPKQAPAEILKKALRMVREFNAKHDSNIYKKAKFGNAFKWGLLELNVDKEFADELTNEALFHMQ